MIRLKVLGKIGEGGAVFENPFVTEITLVIESRDEDPNRGILVLINDDRNVELRFKVAALKILIESCS